MITRKTFIITSEMLLKSDFKTVKINYPYLPKKEIYKVEYDIIKNLITNYKMEFEDILQIHYVSGMITPFEYKCNVSGMSEGYELIILFRHQGLREKKEIPKQSEKNPFYIIAKKEIENLFQLAEDNITAKKQIYKKLMLKYHPDRTKGDVELAQLINSFKTWK